MSDDEVPQTPLDRLDLQLLQLSILALNASNRFASDTFMPPSLRNDL